MLLPAVLLAGTLALLAWFARDDVREYRLFKALDSSAQRRARYALWIWKQIIFFALPALAGLALLGRLDALAGLPGEFTPLARLLPPISNISLVLAAMVGGMVAGSLLTAFVTRRGRRPLQIGDISRLLPRNRAELGLAALLSLTAGISEELMFRLFLPLLLVLVTGAGWPAFAIALLIFGLMHRYQGMAGAAMTVLIGALMAFVYLATGSLLFAMALHALLDLNGLVLRPMVTGALRSAAG